MSNVPAALAAALLPHYRIQREIGAGGMATVYLAHDVRHDRDVAIKVLKRELAAVVGPERFITEIRTTAHLRHPHILPLFDSGTADGLPFYVMPFVDGESLRARLRQGPLPLAQAIVVLREIADAMAHAHAAGIVHCDIKPDNVLLSGRHVFLADFGVARAVVAHVGEDQTVTGTSVLVGTPAYMAPEQVTSGAVDHRCDIYAFGVLAYELLTGAPPFAGKRQDVLTAHLTTEPAPLRAVRPDIPPAIADVVMRCLQKRPEQRWLRIDEVIPALAHAGFHDQPSLDVRRGPWRRYTLTAAAVVAASAIAAVYGTRRSDSVGGIAIGKLSRITTEPGLELDPALSPDATTIAYAAGVPGSMRIYVRQIAGGRNVPLTDDGGMRSQRWPQWSSDGSRILFQAGRAVGPLASREGGALFVAPVVGGVPRRITGELPLGFAASPRWSNHSRRVAFAGIDGLYVVNADSPGSPERLAPARETHSPAWSPDDTRIAFVSRGVSFSFGDASLGNLSTSTIFTLDVASGRVTQVTSGDWLDVSPVWMPDGQSLLFVSGRGGGRDVFRQRIRADGGPDGEPERVSSGLNAHSISLSRDGRLLAYSSFVQRANIWSIAIPQGRVASVREATQVTFGTDRIEKLTISPDGKWLAYDSDRDGQADIYKMPLAGGPAEQITHGPNNKFVNDWSPDGAELVYHSMRVGGQRDVFVVSADGMKSEQVTSSPAEEQHSGWGPDSNSLVYDRSLTTDVENQVYIVRRARRGEPWGTPQPLTGRGSSDPKWSPDGRFIAYCMDSELRIMAPDGSGARTLVSRSPDMPTPRYPIWSRDSRTIYFKAYDPDSQSSIWSVPVEGGTPTLLVSFDDPSRRSLRREFATDGKRLYFTVANDESDLWTMELIPR